ncbi:probable ATP-dependent DNA helicase RecS [Montipora capricornis]|uniref:probable ATP-dependent DNA helicase RecS n=1 Tax=Montipora capricornis TaxID=246305 RepID=UPI0035F212FF
MVVVGESHTVDSWGTDRKRGKKMLPAFRKDYGDLATLRSLCKEGTPILALTGTAGKKLVRKIKKLLCMTSSTKEILVSPDRENIMYHVEMVKKGQEMEKLMWLDHVYVPGQPKTPANRIVGIFHSMTLKKYKDRVMDSFKVNAGNVRIVLATSALGMGVNFPDVRYVIHLGPARSIVDHVQQSGRAGRDGKQAYNVVITTGQKRAHCEVDIKNFANAAECLREALMKPLDVTVNSVDPLHNCCSNCKKMCTCNGEDCNCEELPFTKTSQGKQGSLARKMKLHWKRH